MPGLLLLAHLAGQEAPSSVREIAHHSGIPLKTVGSLLRRLRRAGLVRGAPGTGWRLTRPPSEITMQEAVTALAAGPSGGSCRMDYEACVRRTSCPLAPLCRAGDDMLRTLLAHMTLADLRPVVPLLP